MHQFIQNMVAVYRVYCVISDAAGARQTLSNILKAFDQIRLDQIYVIVIPADTQRLTISRDEVVAALTQAIVEHAHATLGDAIAALSYREVCVYMHQYALSEMQATGLAILVATWVEQHPGPEGETVADVFERFKRSVVHRSSTA